MTFQNIASPFTAISSPGVNPAADAFDGVPSSSFATANATINAQAGVDHIGQSFSEPQAIDQITIQHLSAATAIASVVVQTQTSAGDPWVSRKTVTLPKTADVHTIATSGLGAHVGWRLLANANAGSNERWQVAEMTTAVQNAAPVGDDVQAYMTAYSIPLVANPSIGQYTNPADGTSTMIPTGLVILPLDATYYDYNDEFDPVAHRLTAKTARLRHFTVALQLFGNVTGRVHLQINKNGVNFYQPWWPGREGHFTYDIDIPLAVGDYVDVWVQVESGSDIFIDGHRSVLCVS